jgi:hypothetical protein
MLILQTFYRVLDEEMDSFKPASSHDIPSPNSHRHPFLAAEFLPSPTIFLGEMPPGALGLTRLTSVADLNGRNFIHGVVLRRSALVSDRIPRRPQFCYCS